MMEFHFKTPAMNFDSARRRRSAHATCMHCMNGAEVKLHFSIPIYSTVVGLSISLEFDAYTHQGVYSCVAVVA